MKPTSSNKISSLVLKVASFVIVLLSSCWFVGYVINQARQAKNEARQAEENARVELLFSLWDPPEKVPAFEIMQGGSAPEGGSPQVRLITPRAVRKLLEPDFHSLKSLVQQKCTLAENDFKQHPQDIAKREKLERYHCYVKHFNSMEDRKDFVDQFYKRHYLGMLEKYPENGNGEKDQKAHDLIVQAYENRMKEREAKNHPE